jgi:dihydroorotase
VEASIGEGEAREVVDAAGLIAVPGLLDLHVHVYWGVSHFGIDPDMTSLAKGVTTVVDAGSAGAATFPAFRKYVLQPSETRIYSLLNISAMGMIANEVGELEDLRWASVESAVATGRENPDYVVGIKARLSRQTAGEQDVEALKRALEAAQAFDGFVMIHVGDTKTPLEELTAMLRPGDVVTHAFHGRSDGILDDGGRVKPGIREAQQRGIVFDVGHGAGSFAFDTAEKALADGFRPDNISSDLHVYNVEGPVHDQVSVLSKFMHLGLPLDDVIRLSTESAARVLGSADTLGTLRVGAEGDVTVLRREEGDFTFTDSVGVSVRGRERLSHVLTVKAGRVYRPWLR